MMEDIHKCKDTSASSKLSLEQVLVYLNLQVVPKTLSDLDTSLLKKATLGQPFSELHWRTLSFFYASDWRACYDCSKVLLDIIWEHLNTGHWKDVEVTWRYAYTFCSLYKSLSEFALWKMGIVNYTIRNAVKTCDIGLLMGAPVMDNVLAKVVSKLQGFFSKELSKEQIRSGDSQHANACKNPGIHEMDLKYIVKREKSPSLEYFNKNYVVTGVPVIIQDCMTHWPALSNRKWSLDYIKHMAGCRTVPIELGSKYTEEDWSQSLMTIEDFIEKYITHPKSSEIGYLAQHQLFDQIPELQNDIIIPEYCCLGNSEEVDVNAWFGPGGTVSPLHQDPKHNHLAQVVGEKYMRLFSPEHTAMVYPHEGHLLSNTSQVDVDNPNLEQFPLFAKAPYLECILREGEILYIPPKYWHFVRSLSVSFSVSFWWQ